MEKIVLTDPDVFPTPELLSKVLGEKIDLFQETLEYLKIEIPEVNPEWNYYRDGKTWLLKVLLNKKHFVGFWFMRRASKLHSILMGNMKNT